LTAYSLSIAQQIAAIARVNQAAVATRNADDFGGCGIAVINPWALAASP
jgi:predicted nucleic acid-binding protein